MYPSHLRTAPVSRGSFEPEQSSRSLRATVKKIAYEQSVRLAPLKARVEATVACARGPRERVRQMHVSGLRCT